MNINIKRQTEKNKLILLKKDLLYQIQKNKDTINSLRKTDMSAEYVSKRQEIMKEDNKMKEEQLINVKNEIDMIDSGLFDDKIEKDYNNDKKISDDKTRITINIKKKKIEKKIEDKLIYDKLLKKQHKDMRNPISFGDIRYAYKTYTKAVENIPDYLKNNLKKMPDNRGFIYRGVWLFGLLPSDSSTIVMSERISKDTIKITEYTSNSINIYEKTGQYRKFIQSTGRNKKNHTYNLSDLL